MVCADYSYYSDTIDYPGLRLRFEDIAIVIRLEYIEFQNEGHEPENVFFFGFSFGAQLSLEVGRQVNALHHGTHLISRMDRK